MGLWQHCYFWYWRFESRVHWSHLCCFWALPEYCTHCCCSCPVSFRKQWDWILEDMRVLGLVVSAIDKQVTPCHKQGVLTLMVDGWPGQGSWEMEFESRFSALDRIGQNGNDCAPCTCMWVWDCDWCFRQSVEAPAAARKAGVFSYLLWAFHRAWSDPSRSVCASHQYEDTFPHVFLFQQLTSTTDNWLVTLDSYMLSLGPTLLLHLAPWGQFWPQCSPKDGKSISYFCWCF